MPAAHAFRLIVFDVDGTLVDSQAGIAAAMAEAFAGAGLDAPPPQAVRRVVGLNLESAVANLLDAPDRDEALVGRIAESYRRAFLALRSRPDYQEPLFPGAVEVLDALDVPEVCLGVATGKSRRGLMVTLERHGLGERFVTLQTADDGPGKPHPEMLHRAMREVGADPRQTVLIGDTSFDMMMAREAGSGAVGVGWGYHEPDDLRAAGAAHVIDRFDELPGTLAAFGREPV